MPNICTGSFSKQFLPAIKIYYKHKYTLLLLNLWQLEQVSPARSVVGTWATWAEPRWFWCIEGVIISLFQFYMSFTIVWWRKFCRISFPSQPALAIRIRRCIVSVISDGRYHHKQYYWDRANCRCWMVKCSSAVKSRDRPKAKYQYFSWGFIWLGFSWHWLCLARLVWTGFIWYRFARLCSTTPHNSMLNISETIMKQINK